MSAIGDTQATTYGGLHLLHGAISLFVALVYTTVYG